MKKGFVECPDCEHSVSPRLWHNNMHSWIFKVTTSHICPICGKTMYTTGEGGLEPLPKVILITFFVIAVLQLFIGFFYSFFTGIGFSDLYAKGGT